MSVRQLVRVVLVVSLLLLTGVTSIAQEKKVVEFWFPWPSARPVLEEVFDIFESRNPDIEITMSTSGQGLNLREKLYTSMAAGVPPDIVMLVSPIADFIMDGALTPLDSFIEQSQVLRPEDYPPEVFNMFSLGGSIYGIPAIEVGPWLGLNYNEYLFEDAGLKPEAPESLTALLEAHKKLTRWEDDRVVQLGLNPLDGISYNYFPMTWPAIFDQVLYDETTNTISVNTPGMHETFSYLRAFYETASWNAMDAFHKEFGRLPGGRNAMQMQGYWTAGDLRKVENLSFGHGWVPNSRGDKMMVVGGWGAAIPAGAKNAAEAFRVIEFLTSEEAAQLIFKARGWLNGNLTAMRSLDLSDNPKIAFFIESLATADRIKAAEPIPVMLDLRSALYKAATQVVQGEVSPNEALTNVEIDIQGKLNEIDAFKYRQQ